MPDKGDFLTGMAVGDVGKILEGLALREAPSPQYALFECQMDVIGPTWQTIYDNWLANSEEYAEDKRKACFEYFPPGAAEGKAPVSISVPLKTK